MNIVTGRARTKRYKNPRDVSSQYISETMQMFMRDVPYMILCHLHNKKKPTYTGRHKLNMADIKVYNHTISSIRLDLGITHSHCSHLIRDLEAADFVTAEWRGRVKLVYLTEKGQRAAEVFNTLMNI